MIILAQNMTQGAVYLADLGGFEITISGAEDLCQHFPHYQIAASDDLISLISSGDIVVNDGEGDLSIANAVRRITLHPHVNPVSPDGKEMIRSDSRPAGTQTCFIMCGDDGDNFWGGNSMRWDFSNDDDLFYGPAVPSGMKCKKISIHFHDPIYIKDGTLYFFDAPWGSYIDMSVVIPQGNYFPNPAGTIPDYALGLPNTGTMYSYASEDVDYAWYIKKHYVYGSCPMGDELNAEGCQLDPVPVGWYVTGYIFTTDNDNTSKGYGSLEIYRARTCLLPGEEV